MTAVEGKALVYQVYPVSSITGEGRPEVLGAWGNKFEQERERGARGGGENGRGNSM